MIVRLRFTLSRSSRRILIILLDLCAIAASIWVAFGLRMGTLTPAQFPEAWWLLVVMPLATIPIFGYFHFYRVILSYLDLQFSVALLKGITLSALILASIAFLSRTDMFPRSVILIYWIVAMLSVGGSRLLIRFLVMPRAAAGDRTVIIYGAGEAGAILIAELAHNPDYRPVALVDDDPELWKTTIKGIPVHSPEEIGSLISRHGAKDVLLALPSVPRERRFQIVTHLQSFPVKVSSIPGLRTLMDETAHVDDIRALNIEDLLGRDIVHADEALLHQCIRDRSVLVSGAGGSIGSELCRQIARLQPTRLVLVEQNEYALYTIEQELRTLADRESLHGDIIPLLGSVLDQHHMTDIMQIFEVETIYHAAAYKHVSLVEYNLVEGVRNNTIGTWHLANAAVSAGVGTFVLVSTDKAVRPTNVMGATKRLAECILQAFDSSQHHTCFSIVRFGNVLDSSGSVIPVFRKQIRNGGPVTVTHPKVCRYFMTIEEASQLVIQAGALGKGGDVFILDMDDPVLILDLARAMIRLAGLRERTPEHPGGDIEITFTGLQPGEKLREELLIENHASGTRHPRIMRAGEEGIAWADLQDVMEDLMEACNQRNCACLQRILLDKVTGYTPELEVQDLAWSRQQESSGTEEVSPPLSLMTFKGDTITGPRSPGRMDNG